MRFKIDKERIWGRGWRDIDEGRGGGRKLEDGVGRKDDKRGVEK